MTIDFPAPVPKVAVPHLCGGTDCYFCQWSNPVLEPESLSRPPGTHRSARTVPCAAKDCEEKVAPYSKSGRCTRHRNGRQPAENPPEPTGPDGLTDRERHTQQALNSFLAARYRRGVRPERKTNDRVISAH